MLIFYVGYNREIIVSMFYVIVVRVVMKFISFEFWFVFFFFELKYRIWNRNCLDGMGMWNWGNENFGGFWNDKY